ATKTRTVNVIECPSVNPITGQCEAEIGDDTQAPLVTLNGDATVHVEGNSTYEDAGATATDNVDGALTPAMSENNVNTAVADTYSVVWSATDNAGNTGSATRTVVVDQEQSGCQVVNPITGQCED
ncbi:MAG: DUF5011 domain-containing protein, partial [Campylobacterales bacterium]|nr:DUF5011 domain-containing protein [Campylobacterales bacterium]